jgi:hypothetical protein
MPNEEINNIPKGDVPKVVKSYLDDGMTKITVTKNESNGRWTVRASG